MKVDFKAFSFASREPRSSFSALSLITRTGPAKSWSFAIEFLPADRHGQSSWAVVSERSETLNATAARRIGRGALARKCLSMGWILSEDLFPGPTLDRRP